MQRKYLQLGRSGAIGTLVLGALCHYPMWLYAAAGELMQDVSFLVIVYAVLVVPHLIIGFANGYLASKRNSGIVLTLSASFIGLMTGIVASGFVFDFMEKSGTTLWNNKGIPIVSNIGWYSLTLTIVGIAVGSLVILSFTNIRDSIRKRNLNSHSIS